MARNPHLDRSNGRYEDRIMRTAAAENRNRQRESAAARRWRGEAGQWRRDVNTGLRSLLPSRDTSGLTGVSWPGGRERYQHANHPLNEASAWPALDSQRMDNSFMGKWGMTGGPNLSGNFPMYDTWTGGEGLQGSQGYPDYGAYHNKWGYNTDMLETGKTAAEQSANFPLGEFSGMEFPPRPIEDDPTLPDFLTPGTGRDSSALPPMVTPGTGVDSSALPDFLTPGTGNRPYDGTPSGVGEFEDEPWMTPEGSLGGRRPMTEASGWKPFLHYITGGLFKNRGGIMSLKR